MKDLAFLQADATFMLTRSELFIVCAHENMQE